MKCVVMKVDLDPESEAIIQAHFDSGLYVSRSEVVREALRLMIRHDALKGGWREVVARHREEQIAHNAGARPDPDVCP